MAGLVARFQPLIARDFPFAVFWVGPSTHTIGAKLGRLLNRYRAGIQRNLVVTVIVPWNRGALLGHRATGRRDAYTHVRRENRRQGPRGAGGIGPNCLLAPIVRGDIGNGLNPRTARFCRLRG